VRILEPISARAFVFEYHAEICTNAEMIRRSLANSTSTSYTLMLDAKWKAEFTASDSEALCLEGEQYSNVARFLTHRCEDANLVDIPMMIDEVNPHYYHVAFFAKRKIDPYEELTWVWLLFLFFF
jgi:hypothetical protein